jgi:L-threonylcarbamoyladenylate synthase
MVDVAKILQDDGVIAFVTDTVWGVGCLPESKKAVKKIYALKNREEKKPLILMSHDIYPLLKYVEPMPKKAHILMKKHFPGALTLVLKKSALTPDFVVSDGDTVGIRVPDNETFRQLCLQIPGGVLATTSANLSNEPPALSYTQAKTLGVDYVVPGVDAAGIASTVALVADDDVKILRQGVLSINQLIG